MINLCLHYFLFKEWIKSCGGRSLVTHTLRLPYKIIKTSNINSYENEEKEKQDSPPPLFSLFETYWIFALTPYFQRPIDSQILLSVSRHHLHFQAPFMVPSAIPLLPVSPTKVRSAAICTKNVGSPECEACQPLSHPFLDVIILYKPPFPCVRLSSTFPSKAVYSRGLRPFICTTYWVAEPSSPRITTSDTTIWVYSPPIFQPSTLYPALCTAA